MRVAANIGWLFQEPSIRERCLAASRAGFRLVESPWPSLVCGAFRGEEEGKDCKEEYREALVETGLEPVLLNAWCGDSHPMGGAADPALQDLFRKCFQETLQFSAAIKCPRIHVMSGMVNPDYSPSRHLATLKDNLKWAESLLTSDDVILTIEPISAKPGYFMDDYDKALDVVKSMKKVKLQLDIFHLHNIAGKVTVDQIKELLPYTGHVQFSQPITRLAPSDDGSIEWDKIIAALADGGYTGCIGAEYTNTDSQTFHWVDMRGGLSF